MTDSAVAQRTGALGIRVVVVDDEPAAREVVTTLLAELEGIDVIGEASNGREAIRLIREVRPDLVFLDVQMPDEDGFGVLEALGDDVPRGVVFVTAHDEHAVRAFEVHALDYLLKPFGRPRFRAAVHRALDRLHAVDTRTMSRTLSSMAGDRRALVAPPAEIQETDATTGDQFPQRIGVRTGAKVVVVEVQSIDWVEASGDYARVHAGNGTYVITQRLHALERLLSAGGFVRIHRSLIVNVKRVRELHRESDGGGAIVLTTGVRLRVSRGRWEALQNALDMPEF
jgi:two-component system, LytTR family, response regulator